MRPLALIVALALVGCLEGGAVDAPRGTPSTLREVVFAQLDAFLRRDVEGVLAYDHDPWVDLGGGSCGPDPPPGCDSANVTHDERRAQLETLFADGEYRAAVEGKRIEDLFEVDAYNETDAERAFEDSGSRSWFPFRKGDRAVHVPPQDGSYFFDGFFRVYRDVNATWLAIAGD